MPSDAQYEQAVLKASSVFGRPDLRKAKVLLDSWGLPVSSSGNFATVFKVEVGGKQAAIRCFLKDHPDRQERYRLISEFLKSHSSPSLGKVEYIERGIRVDGNFLPIVKMDWVAGQTLDEFIDKQIEHRNTAALGALAEKWRAAIRELRALGVAHGDLQHGNVLVEGGEIRLIDYDGMYVPGMKGMGSEGRGNRNYQHPARADEHFGAAIDDFSSIVMYLSLRALAEDPRLWRYGSGENLIFSESDFLHPDASPVFGELAKSKSAEIRQLAKALAKLGHVPVDAVPSLDALLADPTIPDRLPILISLGRPAHPPPPSQPVTIALARAGTAVSGNGPYSAEISRKTPAAIVFLLDRSYSMREPFGTTGLTKAQGVADSVNQALQSLVRKTTKNGQILDYFHIGIAAYNDYTTWLLAPPNSTPAPPPTQPISIVASQAQMEERVVEETNPQGNKIQKVTKVPFWVRPDNSGETQMVEALAMAKKGLEPWTKDHPSAFPPIVLNITDGEPSDGDPRPAARELQRLATNDGSLLLFNIHISSRPGKAIVFPDSPKKLPDAYSRMLFEMSSVLPPHLREAAKAAGFAVTNQSRGFAFNANLPELVRFLQIGTRAGNSP